jgi:hypothetical protein
MKTQELIRAMAADTTVQPPVRRLLPLALGASAAAVGALFYATMGIRPDLGEAIGTVQVALKHVFPIVMALAALGATIRLARPEGRLDGWAWALLAAPTIVAAAFWLTALTTPMALWPTRIVGHSIGACLICIPLIGLPILAGVVWALRSGASVRPALTGALAGVLSGSASAAVYAAYCTDDSPMFWGVWYVLGIAIVAGLGALAGRRLLRW